jgi:hypothetical protein
MVGCASNGEEIYRATAKVLYSPIYINTSTANKGICRNPRPIIVSSTHHLSKFHKEDE